MAGINKLLFSLILVIALPCCCRGASENFIQETENTSPVDTTLSFCLSQIESGIKGEEIYFNTSRAYYLNGNYAASILFAEKALKWNPHCEDCLTILEHSLRASDLERFELPGWSPMDTTEKLTQLFSYQMWFGLAMICLSLYIVFYFGWLLTQNRKLTEWSKRIFLSLTFVFLIFSVHRYYLLNRTSYWILMEHTGLQLSADQNSTLKMQLSAGTKLLKTDQIGRWYKVRTLAYDEGWIEEKYLQAISK